MNDLLYFIQFGSPYAPCSSESDDQIHEDQQGTSKISSFCTPHMGFTEDLSMTFYNSLDPCPSSWHSMSDRHSPVLPSTHVAHKITQREKQIQFQEFKRRQQMFSQTVIPEYVCGSPNFHQSNTPLYGYEQISHERIPQNRSEVNIKSEPVSDYHRPCSNQTEYRTPQPCPVYTNDNQPSYCPAAFMNYPSHQNIPSNLQIYPSHHSTGVNFQLDGYPAHNIFHTNPNYYPNVTFQTVPWIKPEMTYCGQEEITPHRNMSKPSASIKVSMNCDYSGLNQGQTTKHPCINNCRNKPQPSISQPTSNVVHYDIEASVHMKIVENACRDNSCGRVQTKKSSDVDLPSIGSLFEFLNDGQL